MESDDKNGTIEEKTQRRKKHEGGDSCSWHGAAVGGYFEYKCTQADNMVFTIPVTKTIDDLYLFYDGTQVENAQITIDGTNVKSGDLDGYMLPIGKVSAGSEVKVTFQLKGETETGYVRLSAADFDQKEYNNLKEETADRAFIVRDYSSNYIEGNVNAKTDQTLFFSIPYDEGWYVEVDGKPADMWAVGNAFLGIDVSAGEHTVSLSYTSPGASAGWKISSLAIVIFLGSCFVKSRYKSDIKKKE